MLMEVEVLSTFTKLHICLSRCSCTRDDNESIASCLRNCHLGGHAFNQSYVANLTMPASFCLQNCTVPLKLYVLRCCLALDFLVVNIC